jgi:putative SOS response-associated peptidase YedK
MCFSVSVNFVKEELESRYGISFPDKYRYEPSYYYHAFGLPELAAICSDNPDQIRSLRWGLIPSWIKSEQEAEEIRLKTFNARSESIASKPSFSSSFKSKRCIIPVSGFFEWQHIGNKKLPWYINMTNAEIFSLAGLYSEWVSSSTGEVISTFTIITTDANDLMAKIHNSKKRMPVILERSNEKNWIDLSISPSDALDMLKPCPSEILNAHTVSPLINDRSVNRNTPDVIRPFIYQSDNQLF